MTVLLSVAADVTHVDPSAYTGVRLILDTGSVMTALVAIVGAIAAFWRWVLSPAIARLSALGRLVEHELMPNLGTSFRDVVDRTESKVDALGTQLAHHVADASAHYAETAEALDTLDES